MTSHPPDLIDAARAGDPRAWARIVIEYSPKLLAAARSFAVGPHAGIDHEAIVQDVLMHAYATRLRKFRTGDLEDLGAWLKRCAANRMIDAQRREYRRQKILLDLTLNCEGCEGPEAATIMADEAERALAGVTHPLDRQIVLARAAGYLGREIAGVLGLSTRNVFIRLFRLRRRQERSR